jgi:hypothetical protein
VLGAAAVLRSSAPSLEDRLVQAIGEATEAELKRVAVSIAPSDPIVVAFDVPTLDDVSASDVAATIKTTQMLVSKYSRGDSADVLLIQSQAEIGNAPYGISAWWLPSDPQQLLRILGWRRPWDEAFCDFAGLEEFETPGLGTDFTRIAECHPLLESLTICSVEAATGLQGVPALELASIHIIAPVTRVGDLAPLKGIDQLYLGLAEDSEGGRRAVQALLPGTELLFWSQHDRALAAEGFPLWCR